MISVILPTYNGEEFVEDCIEKVMQQDIDKSMFELIIIDDGSTDSTPEILLRMEKKYPDNIVLYLGTHGGRINGLLKKDFGVSQLARGEYILFLDQDDWYRRDAFRILHGLMDKNPELDCIRYSYYRVDREGNIFGVWKPATGILHKYKLAEEKDRNEYAKAGIYPDGDYRTYWCRIYRKRFLIENALLDIFFKGKGLGSGFGDNIFTGLLALSWNCCAVLEEPLYVYRVWAGSDSMKARGTRRDFDRFKVGLRLLGEYEERGLLEKNKEMAEFMFLTNVYTNFWHFLKLDPIPYSVLAYMQESVQTLCPDYRENTIAKAYMDMEKLFAIMKHDWTPEFLDGLKEYVEKETS